MKLSYRQRGMSALSMLVVVLVAIFFGTCVIKMVPIYLQHNSIKTSVESTVEEAKANNYSTKQIKGKLSKLFQVNMIESVSLSDIKITREKGITTVDARYEERLPLMFNIDVVVKFEDMLFEFSGQTSK